MTNSKKALKSATKGGCMQERQIPDKIEMDSLPTGTMVVVERRPGQISANCQTKAVRGYLTAVEAISKGHLTKENFVQFHAEEDSHPVNMRIGAFVDNGKLITFLEGKLHRVTHRVMLPGGGSGISNTDESAQETITSESVSDSLMRLLPTPSKAQRMQKAEDKLIGLINLHNGGDTAKSNKMKFVSRIP